MYFVYIFIVFSSTDLFLIAILWCCHNNQWWTTTMDEEPKSELNNNLTVLSANFFAVSSRPNDYASNVHNFYTNVSWNGEWHWHQYRPQTTSATSGTNHRHMWDHTRHKNVRMGHRPYRPKVGNKQCLTCQRYSFYASAQVYVSTT